MNEATRFFGEPLFSARYAGLDLVETVHTGAERLPMHEHSRRYLAIVLNGSYEESSRGQRIEAAAGSMLGHPDGHRHANHIGRDGARCLNVIPDAHWKGDAVMGRVLDLPTHLQLDTSGDALLRLRRELRQHDDLSALAVSSAVLELLVVAQRRARRNAPPTWLVRVCERLDEDSLDVPTLQELSDEAGIHPAHLSRVFRRCTGKSVGAYVRARRLERALSLLSRTSVPLVEVAARAGFSDQAHLSRAVRGATALTPSTFRARMQGRFKNA